jgi:hypothetical protein
MALFNLLCLVVHLTIDKKAHLNCVTLIITSGLILIVLVKKKTKKNYN